MINEMRDLDLLIVGGGVAGSALARAMALSQKKVFLVEKTETFHDRIRGEILMPWGVAEAEELDLLGCFLSCGAKEIWMRHVCMGGVALPPSSFRDVSPSRPRALSFYHPHMQDVLLRAAKEAGARVKRNAQVCSISGSPPEVIVAFDGEKHRVSPRLVVLAGEREQNIPGLESFRLRNKAPGLRTTGLEFDVDLTSEPLLNIFLKPECGLGSIVVQNRPGHVRAYLLHHEKALQKIPAGRRGKNYVFNLLVETGVPRSWLRHGRMSGPCATFNGDYRWPSCVARDGIVAVGDSAGVTDPAWANGLSRTLRDVRILRDFLISCSDWHSAILKYADEHEAFVGRLRRLEKLNAAIFFSTGAEANLLRERALALMQEHPELDPDMAVLGPEENCDARLEKIVHC